MLSLRPLMPGVSLFLHERAALLGAFTNHASADICKCQSSSGTASLHLSALTTKEIDFKIVCKNMRTYKGEATSREHHRSAMPPTPRTTRKAPSLRAALLLRAVMQVTFPSQRRAQCCASLLTAPRPPHTLPQHHGSQKSRGSGGGGAEVKSQPHHLLTESFWTIFFILSDSQFSHLTNGDAIILIGFL